MQGLAGPLTPSPSKGWRGRRWGRLVETLYLGLRVFLEAKVRSGHAPAGRLLKLGGAGLATLGSVKSLGTWRGGEGGGLSGRRVGRCGRVLGLHAGG